MTRRVVFLGPTLSRAEAAAICHATYRPPAQRGDIVRAVLHGAEVIGLIDGFLHQSLAATHKEILFALHRGVPLFGAASLGALRAAELADHGMIGIGRVFEAYREGGCSSDEVAVSHGPGELGYLALSEAMVNVRATVAAAVSAGVLLTSAEGIIAIARALHFPERTWPRLIGAARGEGLAAGELDTFAAWLPLGRVDRKRLDAIALLEHLAASEGSAFSQASEPSCFQPTQAFAALYDRVCSEMANEAPVSAGTAAKGASLRRAENHCGSGV
jgi:hypothetical protein